VDESGPPSAPESAERLREVVQDLYLARETERELREEASALLRGLTAISEASTPDDVITHLLASLQAPFGYGAAFLLRVGEGDALSVASATDPAFEAATFVVGKTFERTLRGRVSTLLSTAQVAEWQALPENLRERVKSAMYLPLKGESDRAILVLTHPEERAFQPRHEQLAKRFLPLLNQALRDAERRGQLVRANRDMRLVLDNVAQGLLTVDKRCRVVGERSAIVDRWFGEVRPGTTFEALLARKSPTSSARFARAWAILVDSRSPDRFDALPRDLQVDGLELRIEYRPVPSAEDWQQVLVVLTDMTTEIQRRRLEREALDARRRNELSIAHQVQTSILPRNLLVPGFEIAARMQPAEEVGGDYYDVIADPDGCWLAIGDVSGHGLQAGLLMLMVQSSILTTARVGNGLSPRDVIIAANQMLYENGRVRLGENDHMTLSAFRLLHDGTFEVAGAHDPPLIHRAKTGAVELAELDGTWIGVIRDVAPFTHISRNRLAPGDTLWLYTDGLIEAMNDRREQFGLPRFYDLLRRYHRESVATICNRVFDALLAWSPVLADDATIVGARYLDLEGRSDVHAS
jgi:serine phosphatase RsbU (regulator of sigma subunit)